MGSPYAAAMEPRIPPVSLADAGPDGPTCSGSSPRLRGDDAIGAQRLRHAWRNHPTLLREWLVFANYILVKSTLDPRRA